MREFNAIITIAYRDFTKFLRDKPRLLISFVFPLLFIGILGKTFDANLSSTAGFNFLAFIFTGVLAQVLFQSTASGVISLIEDRENDFSQAVFVAPVSRYSIILGKILGESLVSLAQAIGIVVFGLILGVPLTLGTLLALIPAAIIACFLGGAFGIFVLANLGTQRRANQIFPLVIFPQFFLAGAINPIHNLPPILFFLSRITPLTYAVDLVRNVYYAGTPEYAKTVLYGTVTNLLVITLFFSIFLALGTYFFVRNERNK
ncbi:MAG: ABC transporter permease [Candidatus Sungbacteria bacterium]|nr:ABC transporter permease [Candidatus Sungbacteria bacterium]